MNNVVTLAKPLCEAVDDVFVVGDIKNFEGTGGCYDLQIVMDFSGCPVRGCGGEIAERTVESFGDSHYTCSNGHFIHAKFNDFGLVLRVQPVTASDMRLMSDGHVVRRRVGKEVV